MRLGEVVHIYPVRRTPRGFGPRLYPLPHQGVPAATGGAHDVQVVAVAIDAGGQFDGVGGAFLAGDTPQVLDLIGSGKAELRWIAAVCEVFHGQGLEGWVRHGGGTLGRI